MKDNYILIEREKNAPDWEHRENFETLESARATMMERYHELAIEQCEICEAGDFFARCAWVILKDGNEISWDIVDAHEED